VSVKKEKKTRVKRPATLFDAWWDAYNAQEKIDKFVRRWRKSNPPNPEDEDCGGDHWHVNQMVHTGEADEMCLETARDVFTRTLTDGEDGRPTQLDSLYCDLDDIVDAAYEAALAVKNRNE
jgi:hypothetical protein